MHRRADRWQAAVKLKHVRVRYGLHLTFTVASGDWGEMDGEMRRFWHDWRREFSSVWYFWWLEKQARGAPTSDAFVLNPPYRPGFKFIDWVRAHWPHGAVELVPIRKDRWKQQGVGYVTAYAKKKGPKRYQQDYSDTPAGIHLCGSNVKGVSDRELDAHIDRWESQYEGGAVVLTARLEHVSGAPCQQTPGWRAREHLRRAMARARRTARRWTNFPRERDELLKRRKRSRKPRPVVAVPGGPGQLELFSEYWAWHARAYELPWDALVGDKPGPQLRTAPVPAAQTGGFSREPAESVLPAAVPCTLTRNPGGVSTLRPNLSTRKRMQAARRVL